MIILNCFNLHNLQVIKAGLDWNEHGDSSTLSSSTCLPPTKSCTLVRAAVAIPTADVAFLAKKALFRPLLWLFLQRILLLLLLRRILRHNRLLCWPHDLLRRLLYGYLRVLNY